MTVQNTQPSLWRRVRGPLAALTAVGFLGTAVVAPLTLPTAFAEEAYGAQNPALYQEFVPNENPVDDFVLPELDAERLPDPEPEPAPEPESDSETSSAEGSESSDAPVEQATLRYTGGGSPAEWMAAAGIAEADWGFVDFIVSRESGWNPNAVNPSSGASGLVQALPCGKVPGSCFDPIDNLRWADGYAKGRYGSWAAAHSFWTANHWW